MYINTQIMARTIMISNGAYEKLKALKGEKSFSEVIMDLVEKKEEKKTVGNLFKNCAGILKGDKEDDRIMRDARRGWKNWSKRYA